MKISKKYISQINLYHYYNIIIFISFFTMPFIKYNISLYIFLLSMGMGISLSALYIANRKKIHKGIIYIIVIVVYFIISYYLLYSNNITLEYFIRYKLRIFLCFIYLLILFSYISLKKYQKIYDISFFYTIINISFLYVSLSIIDYFLHIGVFTNISFELQFHFASRNPAGSMLLFLYTTSLYIFLTKNKKYKYYVIVFLIGAFLTNSRNAMLGTIIMTIITLIYTKKINFKIIFYILFVSILLLFFLQVEHNFLERFTSTFDSNEATVADRIRMIKLAISLVDIDPIFGLGFGNTDSHLHNNFLQILVEFGIFGFIIIIGFYFIMYKKGNILQKLLVIAFILSGMTEYTIGAPSVSIIFYILYFLSTDLSLNRFISNKIKKK